MIILNNDFNVSKEMLTILVQVWKVCYNTECVGALILNSNKTLSLS